jgi:hypothetical protein
MDLASSAFSLLALAERNNASDREEAYDVYRKRPNRWSWFVATRLRTKA